MSLETNMTVITNRNAELKQMLSDRRRDMQDGIQRRMREGRLDPRNDVGDTLDRSDAGNQGEIELALIQMRANTVARIDQALVRLEAGEYGSCSECASEITERRLRALPFAVRCQACEGRREEQQGRARQFAHERSSLPLFTDTVSA
jgi:RNA polymerase-binding transcription factor